MQNYWIVSMSKYSQGRYLPKYPAKLIGSKSPQYRSSWELSVMNFLDTHPSVIQWGSECLSIPYKNPFTGKQTVYVPDFLIKYQDKSGRQRVEMIEVKPKKETFMEAAKSKRDRAFVVLNSAKWRAAMEFCSRNGIHFRVLNEDQIFVNKGKR